MNYVLQEFYSTKMHYIWQTKRNFNFINLRAQITNYSTKIDFLLTFHQKFGDFI